MKQDNPTVLKSPEAGPYGREGRGEPPGVRRLCVALDEYIGISFPTLQVIRAIFPNISKAGAKATGF